MHAHPRLRSAGWALAALCALLLPAPGRAGFLPVTLDDNGPTILSAWPDGTLSYNATTLRFHSDSLPLVISRINPPLFGLFDSGNVSIDLLVDHNGNFISNGTGFALTGGVDLDGDGIDDASGTLLTGTITAFGLGTPPGPPTVDFDGKFVITGGQFTQPIPLSGGGTEPPLFSVGQTGGFILSAESVTSGTLGNFNSSFSSDTGKDLEGPLAASVPQPAAISLGLLGVGVVLGWAALRRRSPLAA
jgi:hypothetical protein